MFANKMAAPLLSRPEHVAVASVSRELCNRPMGHKGQPRSQAVLQPPKSSQGLHCLPGQVCAMAMAESNRRNVKVDLEKQPTPEAVSRVSAQVTQEDSKSADRPDGIGSLVKVPVTAAQGDIGTDTAENAKSVHQVLVILQHTAQKFSVCNYALCSSLSPTSQTCSHALQLYKLKTQSAACFSYKF